MLFDIGLTRRRFCSGLSIAALSAVLPATAALAKSLKLNTKTLPNFKGVINLREHALLEIDLPRSAWGDIELRGGRKDISLKDYLNGIGKAGFPIDRKPILVTLDPNNFPNGSPELAGRLEQIGENRILDDWTPEGVYICLILYYSCVWK